MGNAFCTFRIHNDGSDDEINNRQDTRHNKHRGKNDLADDNTGDFHNQTYVQQSLVLCLFQGIWSNASARNSLVSWENDFFFYLIAGYNMILSKPFVT